MARSAPGTCHCGTANFTGDHTEENINKVTYYTPRFAGFQVGVSYLPDQTNRGQGNAYLALASPESRPARIAPASTLVCLITSSPVVSTMMLNSVM